MATDFQKRVWDAISQIPKGRVTTYKAITKHLDSNAVRAVGTAVGKNPYAPDVPCHRVVRSDGTIGNYSGEGGVSAKIKLLSDEGVVVEGAKIADFEDICYCY